MGARLQYTLYCDECRHWIQSADSNANDLRRMGKLLGWRRVLVGGHVLTDLCPRCASEFDTAV